MLTKEDVDSWNKLFPDCQINKINLSNPNEHFLTNALVCYLRRFGYHVNPPFNSSGINKENNRETRLFLIKLARQIDHFLKITDKTYCFTYYDLIRPTPKKTAHMLYILLNYYYYYNLYKEDVFKMAGDRVHKLEELRVLIDNTRRENELRKEENKNMKSIITNLTEEIPKATTELKEMIKKRAQQDEKCQNLNHSYQELKEKLKHLEEQKKILRKRVVPKEEYQELCIQIQKLKLELVEYKEMESTSAANLNECKESNAKLQILSEEVKRASEIIPLHIIKQVKDTKKQLVQAQKEEHELKITENNMLLEIEEENVKNLSLIQELKNKKQEFETKQIDLIKTLTEKQSTLKQKDVEIALLEKEEHLAECQLEEQKAIAQYLLENVSEILSAYEN